MFVDIQDIKYTRSLFELREKILDFKLKHNALTLYKKDEILRDIYKDLTLLIKCFTKYNFIESITNKTTLLVGEGNLSFTLSLVKKLSVFTNIISSTYESYNELSDYGKKNAQLLKQMGVKLLYSVDCIKLHKNFATQTFDRIIFQFPHTGSRDPIRGLNSNYVLIRNFIASAACVLKKNGIILITTVDNDFYNNMFRLEELSTILGINKPVKYKFNPKDYAEYVHTMTNEDESAIENHNNFATWEFKI